MLPKAYGGIPFFYMTEILSPSLTGAPPGPIQAIETSKGGEIDRRKRERRSAVSALCVCVYYSISRHIYIGARTGHENG